MRLKKNAGVAFLALIQGVTATAHPAREAGRTSLASVDFYS
jgi:hypothetical protein